MGCEKKLTVPVFTYKETGQQFYRCPIKLVTNQTWFLLALYNHYKNGYLAFAGGVLDQPEWYLKRMEKIQELEYRMREEYNPRGAK